MKRLAKKQRRILRNTFYPDLKIQLFYKEFPLTLNLEVDCGNKKKSYWLKKTRVVEQTNFAGHYNGLERQTDGGICHSGKKTAWLFPAQFL